MIQHPDKHLLFMLKEPVSGRVKTRLAETLGAAEACAAYRRLVEHNMAVTQGFATRGVYYTPHTAQAYFETWLDAEYYSNQVEGDLGDRMLAAVQHSLKHGATAVCLLGGDCPYVDAVLLAEGFAALEQYDVVIGPAIDGGYYALLLKQPIPELFQGIEWGKESVLQTTLEIAQRLQLSVQLLREAEDVDDAASWKRALAAFPELGLV